MTTTKKFNELTTRRSVVLKNKHIAILANQKIDDLNKFVQNKIEELVEPEPVEEINKKIHKEVKDAKIENDNEEFDIEKKDIKVF